MLAPGLRLSLKVEPGIAMPLSHPQNQVYDQGFAQTLKLLMGISRYVEVGPSATFMALAADDDVSAMDTGTAWSFGASGRVMRPRDVPGGMLTAVSPWVDADVLYVRTGDLDRPGVAGAIGAAFPMDERRRFWFGPFARYSHIFQGERDGFDTRDAKLLTIGLSLEVGSGLDTSRQQLVATDEGEPLEELDDAPPPEAPGAEPAPVRVYEKVVVLPDRLELKEKIAFEWNSAVLEPSSNAVLDDVVRAMKDHPNFRVQVDGHASSEGGEAHNQTLSEERSAAVMAYLIAGGIEKERLVSVGFSSSQPIQSNETAAGRESNRRVEFLVKIIIVKEGNTP